MTLNIIEDIPGEQVNLSMQESSPGDQLQFNISMLDFHKSADCLEHVNDTEVCGTPLFEAINETFANSSVNNKESEEDLMPLYEICLPIILLLCLTALILNCAILAAILSTRQLMKLGASRGYLPTVTSMVTADSLSSLLLGVQLLNGSYLPIVWNIHPPKCLLLPLECIKMGAAITTVLHLVLMSFLHVASVAYPLEIKKVLRPGLLLSVLLFLWLLPSSVLVSLFSAMPGELFLSESCSQYTLLLQFNFRAAYTSAIFVPLIIISISYIYFYYVLARRRTLPNNRTVSRQNFKAAKITLLVLISCSVCWVPVSVSFIAICPTGCYFHPANIKPTTSFCLHAIANFLLVGKSIVNPIIFALRNRQIRHALHRLIHCKDPKDEDRRERQRSVTKNSYIYRSTRIKPEASPSRLYQL